MPSRFQVHGQLIVSNRFLGDGSRLVPEFQFGHSQMFREVGGEGKRGVIVGIVVGAGHGCFVAFDYFDGELDGVRSRGENTLDVAEQETSIAHPATETRGVS